MVSTYIYVPMLWTEKHPNYKWPLLSQTAHSQLILPQDTVVLFVDFKMHMIWRKEKQEGNKKNHQPITTCVVMFWIFFFCHKHLQGDLYISMGACYKPYKERNVNFAITISKILPALPPCWKCLENSFFQPAFRSKKVSLSICTNLTISECVGPVQPNLTEISKLWSLCIFHEQRQPGIS